jgi:hypothetical protein
MTGDSGSSSSTWSRGEGLTSVQPGSASAPLPARRTSQAISERVRFAIILPEAAEADAERLHRRVQFALGGRAGFRPDGVRFYAGLVELRTEDDANVFRERAEAALERAKQAAADRLSAAQ